MQCFHKYIYLFFPFYALVFMCKLITPITVLDKGVVSLHNNSVGLQFYIDIENTDKLCSCLVSARTKDCCLTDNSEEDCNTMFVYGGQYFVEPKDRETVIYVYPTLYQHDQYGYCNFILDYKCGRNRRSKRHNVKIEFDTRIQALKKYKKKILEHYIADKKRTSCDSFDQDSLNYCEPVNCDLKYCGERPFYDESIAKCVEASLCESNPESELPDIVYVPSINVCRDLEHPLTVGDIYAISTGMGVVTKLPKPAEVKVELKSNCSTISQNLKLLRDLLYGKLCPLLKTDMSDYSECCKSAFISIILCIGAACAVLFSFICCVQTLLWLHRKFIEGDLRECFNNLGSVLKKPMAPHFYDSAGVNNEVRNTLLREVIVRDIPIELRDSIVDICDRMNKKVKKRKRYRRGEVGSQISLNQVDYDVRTTTTTSTTSTDDCEDKQELLK